jgi:DNA-binding IclR family transcriptional regulator
VGGGRSPPVPQDPAAQLTASSPAKPANATADRAIEILLLFSQDAPVWTAPEIGARLDMPRSTIYRYLGSLRSHALIVQDTRGSYALGPRLLQLAQVAKAANPVMGAVAPHMRDLADRFKENVVLNERVGSEILSLERIESPQQIVLKSSRTHLLPWPATGSAKVFLAFAAEPEQREILATLQPTAYTPHTLTSLRELKAHLSEVKAQGHAVSDEERDEGVWGASVPIGGPEGCRYALSIVGPKFRIHEKLREEMIAGLRKAAKAVAAAFE